VSEREKRSLHVIASRRSRSQPALATDRLLPEQSSLSSRYRRRRRRRSTPAADDDDDTRGTRARRRLCQADWQALSQTRSVCCVDYAPPLPLPLCRYTAADTDTYFPPRVPYYCHTAEDWFISKFCMFFHATACSG